MIFQPLLPLHVEVDQTCNNSQSTDIQASPRAPQTANWLALIRLTGRATWGEQGKPYRVRIAGEPTSFLLLLHSVSRRLPEDPMHRNQGGRPKEVRGSRDRVPPDCPGLGTPGCLQSRMRERFVVYTYEWQPMHRFLFSGREHLTGSASAAMRGQAQVPSCLCASWIPVPPPLGASDLARWDASG